MLELRSYRLFLWMVVLQLCAQSGHLRCTDVGRTLICKHTFPIVVSTTISTVIVNDLKNLTVERELFSGTGWRHVTRLVIKGAKLMVTDSDEFRFTNSCFQHLTSLEDLHIHVTPCTFEAGIFTGLDKVTTLDLNNCTTLSNTALLSSMKSPNILPNLINITLRRVGTRSIGGDRISFDSQFWGIIGSRPVVYADLSNMHVDIFDSSAFAMNCDNLVKLQMSGTSIMKSLLNQNMTDMANFERKACANLKEVDISHQRVVYAEFCNPLLLKNLSALLEVATEAFWMFSNIKILKANFVCRYFSLNIQVKSFERIRFDTLQIKQLYLDGNDLQRLDIDVNCVVTSNIETISLRQNGLEYINPSMFVCLKKVRIVYLADNNLAAMVERNSTQFGQLFSSLHILLTIELAMNHLKYLPTNVFTNNSHLRDIDLSSNLLEHFHVNITHMPNLTVLNLTRNRLKVLDHVFMSIVKMSANTVNIRLTENPLICGSCDHYDFIKMILSNRRFEVNRKGLTCQRELEQFVDIDSEVERELKLDCNNRTQEQDNAAGKHGQAHSNYLDGIYTGLLCVALLSMVTASALATRKCLEVVRQRRHLNEMQVLIREGQERFHFVVFLAFCNQDRRFVAEQVVPPLQECLTKKTGAVRKLVCVGDTDILPNEMLLSGLARLMEQSNVVVVILTKELCRDHMRAVELNEVCLRDRDIVFLVKDIVEDADMHPLLRTVYKHAHTFFWKEDAQGDYALTTTWDHVGDVVLRLVK